jgi:APA family basic amino acid/polyamine antiporter
LGYPAVPVLFVLVAVLLLSVTLVNAPRESGLGLVIIAAGFPFYRYWKRRVQPAESDRTGRGQY